jgi:hypothetical protein
MLARIISFTALLSLPLIAACAPAEPAEPADEVGAGTAAKDLQDDVTPSHPGVSILASSGRACSGTHLSDAWVLAGSNCGAILETGPTSTYTVTYASTGETVATGAPVYDTRLGAMLLPLRGSPPIGVNHFLCPRGWFDCGDGTCRPIGAQCF